MLITLVLILIFPSLSYALDTQTYSERDNTYSSYQSQISTLYRNMIDGEGQSYLTQDSYTNYYGETKVVTTDVTSKIFVNNPSYYSSDLHKRIDRTVEIDKYSLKELNVNYADKANTADKSEVANLTRVSDFGGYYPKDCTLDETCKIVKWVPESSYAMYANTADEADTEICPVISLDLGVSESPLSDNPFIIILSKRFPEQHHFCYYKVHIKKIYHAQNTDAPVEKSLYLVATGNYNTAINYDTATCAQRTGTAQYAHTLTDFNPITKEEVEALLSVAPSSVNSQKILNSYLSYTRGNKKDISIYVP